MASALHIPRINNNDDYVKVLKLHAERGDRVEAGDCVAQIETDKAVVDLEAEAGGYVLEVRCDEDEMVPVGDVMMWIGDDADEPVPQVEAPVTRTEPAKISRHPTAKARTLLKRYGLSVEDIPYCGERLTAKYVEQFVARQQDGELPTKTRSLDSSMTPPTAGTFRDLTPEEHGMLNTVRWHRDDAAATYLELEYDQKPWEEHAARYGEENQLMLSPLIPLLAYRLVEIATQIPKINSTVVDGRGYQYDEVNLGFTVQSGDILYLTVMHGAEQLNTKEFIEELGEIQRRAIARKPRAEDVQGATIAFSSMARWNVTRHVPILPPFSSLIVAHAASRESGSAVMGATYDHRVLSGYDVIQVLQRLTKPPTV